MKYYKDYYSIYLKSWKDRNHEYFFGLKKINFNYILKWINNLIYNDLKQNIKFFNKLKYKILH